MSAEDTAVIAENALGQLLATKMNHFSLQPQMKAEAARKLNKNKMH